MTSRVAIAIFAKAPVAGFAKTRLIPRFGAETAASLQRLMIERAIRTAVESRVGPVSLWCAPDCSAEVFSSLAAKYSLELHSQSGRDLGARMLHAFEVLTVVCPVIVIGCDCPALQPSHLRKCARDLGHGHDAVFIPTEDGGYALIAAAKPWPQLFSDIPWGSSEVMSRTRTRAIATGLRVAEPVMLWDVDTPEDVDRAAALGLLNRTCEV
ncbi:MAG: TIGR04282 family arsenosugar biosynthesis glycosyltransferase [Variibacter sp.]